MAQGNLAAFPPSMAVSRDGSRQSCGISTIHGSQPRWLKAILRHFHPPWQSAAMAQGNLAAFPPSLEVKAAYA